MSEKYEGFIRRKRTSFFILALLGMMAIGLFLSGENNSIMADEASDETELIGMITGATPGIPLYVEVKNNIILSANETIEIPEGISIILKGDYTIIGTNGCPTITVNGTLKIDGVNVTHEKGDDGVGVYNNGTLIMVNGTISGNSATDGAGVYNNGIFTMTGGTITANSATDGGGVLNNGIFNMSDNAIISYNSASKYGGGVYNTGKDGGQAVFNMTGGTISDNKALVGGGYASYSAIFNMSGNAVISDNKATHGGGVSNWDFSTLSMAGGTISDNTATYGGGVNNYDNSTFELSGGFILYNTVVYYGGGVFNWEASTFNVSGGDISFNVALQGGGIANWANGATTPVAFVMSGGIVSHNKAVLGGGIFNNGLAEHTLAISNGIISYNTATYGGGIHSACMLSITGGKIIGNDAKGADMGEGSGGGIFTTDLSKLEVGDGVVFSDNKAPTLRKNNIAANADSDGNGIPDLKDYANIGNVKLDSFAERGQNASAYNNYDINYPGDTYVVTVSIKPSSSGVVTIADCISGAVYGILTANGNAFVPVDVKAITITASSRNGYEFVRFVIDGASETCDVMTDVLISESMHVTAEFVISLTHTEHHYYTITASADSGSEISPGGGVRVPYGINKGFTFSAKPGHQITDVYVDGVAISSTELASGKYTFYDVHHDHTIVVVSDGGVGEGDTLVHFVGMRGETKVAR